MEVSADYKISSKFNNTLDIEETKEDACNDEITHEFVDSWDNEGTQDDIEK